MDLSAFALTDRVAIVTGGGQGIGKAIALCFADVGANLVIAERVAETAEATVTEIKAKGRKALAIPVDVREPEQIDNMVKLAVAEFGRIDIHVNNAGGQFPLPLLEYTEKGWAALMRENLNSVFLCTKAVGKMMVAQKKGCIINITSVAGVRPTPNAAAYSAAKAGIINLTMSSAVELGPYNIRVNAIAPGTIVTPGVASQYEKDPGRAERRISMTPLGRLGKPEDIGKVAVFLASEAADFISGVTLVVDGGWSVKTI